MGRSRGCDGCGCDSVSACVLPAPVFYSTRKARVWTPPHRMWRWLRVFVCLQPPCARVWACVRARYSFQILSKAWFPRGNDRGHLIGEGWKQHLHPIGHTHDIKVLARQKHVKEIYIAAVTAPHTRGHSPLPLPIIKVTCIVCEPHIPHYQ